MKKHIEKINYQPAHAAGEININLAGRDLIITGGNGCGKTTFLNAMNKHIQHIYVDKKHDAKEQLLRNLAHWQSLIDNNPKGTSQHAQGEEQRKYTLRSLSDYETGVQITIPDTNKFCALLDEGKAIYKYFIAERRSDINASSGATKANLDDKISRNKFQANEQRLGSEFENHLVNLKTRQSFAETYDKDFQLSSKLQQWFDELEKNISILMEDDSFALKFDSDGFNFLLTQDNKAPYTFQSLSSGYSSIFNILSELIMVTEAYKTSPQDMQGLVLIDEIDAHLHVSLQRKILPFLNGLYPNIQFIVTTHSPFVIGSLDNAVVFDLSSKQEFTELSNYSYEAIVEGLLGVPVVSMSLEKDIKRLSGLLSENTPDVVAITELVEKLSPHNDKLDDESAVFLIKAKMFLRDEKKGA
ncbi:TPA: AAA family ATPase [Klebsiella aerogenes]|uniref:AAA family ATPase n=1 Tax=Klebsiella aerogenes TaxID=548 RepID=UPI0025A4B389|nr:AAA family ATPase [Klebsiella aerogenes]MDM8056900.1 AAA family ATPase [Klebsiella aerogenes]MDM8078192.1 AAA family ATPase [Klebsiella aerogenes]MDY0847639.1 AAA family ATPase [Klebsiella aerogenes]WPS33879.1 AAA family ATPase [Klebsiella aerogenes]HDU4322122.1 AAA family ATPase [Klebsiella aerogenes]